MLAKMKATIGDRAGWMLRLGLVVGSGLVLGASIAILASLLSSAMPGPNDNVLPYDGFLTDDAGTPLDGTFNIAFLLQGEGGRSVTDTHNSVRVRNGRFSVPIGGGSTQLPDWVFTESNLSLRIRVNNTLLAGTQTIYPMPYAYLSLGAEDFELGSDLDVPEVFRTGGLRVRGDLESETLSSGGLVVDGVLRLGPQGGSLAQQDTAEILLDGSNGLARLPRIVNLEAGRTISYNNRLDLRTNNTTRRMLLGQGTTPLTDIPGRLAVGSGTDSGLEIFGPSNLATGLTLNSDGITVPGGRLEILRNSGSGTATLNFTALTLGSNNRFVRSNVVETRDGIGRSMRPSPGGTAWQRRTYPRSRDDWFCGLTALGAAGRHHVYNGCRVEFRDNQWAIYGDYSRSGENEWESGYYCRVRCFRY